jgi:hypothetical protein
MVWNSNYHSSLRLLLGLSNDKKREKENMTIETGLNLLGLMAISPAVMLFILEMLDALKKRRDKQRKRKKKLKLQP